MIEFLLYSLLSILTVGGQTPTAFHHHKVSLAWHKGTYPPTVVYRIYRAPIRTGIFTRVAESTQPVWVDFNVSGDRTYFYFVTAFDQKTSDESAASNIVEAIVP